MCFIFYDYNNVRIIYKKCGLVSVLKEHVVDHTQFLCCDVQVSNFHLDGHHERSPLHSLQRDHVMSQKATSLPSSPHDYRGQASERSGASEYSMNDELESTWNKVLESPMFSNRPLLPYDEWNINFSELTVGTRVGIGKFQLSLHSYQII